MSSCFGTSVLKLVKISRTEDQTVFIDGKKDQCMIIDITQIGGQA